MMTSQQHTHSLAVVDLLASTTNQSTSTNSQHLVSAVRDQSHQHVILSTTSTTTTPPPRDTVTPEIQSNCITTSITKANRTPPPTFEETTIVNQQQQQYQQPSSIITQRIMSAFPIVVASTSTRGMEISSGITESNLDTKTAPPTTTTTTTGVCEVQTNMTKATMNESESSYSPALRSNIITILNSDSTMSLPRMASATTATTTIRKASPRPATEAFVRQSKKDEQERRFNAIMANKKRIHLTSSSSLSKGQNTTGVSPLIQWANLFNVDDSDDSSLRSSLDMETSSTQPNMTGGKICVGTTSNDTTRSKMNESCSDNDSDDDSDNDSFSSDDDSVSPSDDEEETRVAQALVKAAYSGVSTPALDRLLGRKPTPTSTMQLVKRKRQSQIDLYNSQQHQYNAPPGCVEPKRQRVCIFGDVQNNNHHNSNIPGGSVSGHSVASMRSDTAAVVGTAAYVAVKKMNQLKSMITSESAPAFRQLLESASPPRTNNSTNRNHEFQSNSVKPDDYLRNLLTSSGCNPVPSLIPYDKVPTGFFSPVSPEGIAGYDLPVVTALRQENVDALRTMYEKDGKLMHCGNKFGETLLHAAARRRSHHVVHFLLRECNNHQKTTTTDSTVHDPNAVTAKVCCDSGRTPLHDACWTVEPNFRVVDLLLDDCPDLLYITDKRGFTPLAYVRKELWGPWCEYLHDRGATKLLPVELK